MRVIHSWMRGIACRRMSSSRWVHAAGLVIAGGGGRRLVSLAAGMMKVPWFVGMSVDGEGEGEDEKRTEKSSDKSRTGTVSQTR